MTITDLVPLQSTRQRALSELLAAVGEALHEEGFARHEFAVQTIARAGRPVAPGASAALAGRTTADPARERAFGIVVRVIIQCGDEATGRRLTTALARYAPAARTAPEGVRALV